MAVASDKALEQRELQLYIPAASEHLRTVRLVVADAAERAGFDVDETDDLRIALDELCHAVLRTSDAPMLVAFAVQPGRVEVRGVATSRGWRRVELSPISELIVDAVSDRYELVAGPRELRFSLVKRRRVLQQEAGTAHGSSRSRPSQSMP